MFMIPSWVKYCLPFLAGVGAMWLYHSSVISGIDADQSREVAAQSTLLVEQTKQDVKDNDDNTFQYLEHIAAANQAANDLRKRLADGSISIRLCRADAITARVQAANSDAAKDQAEADYARYKEDVIELIRRGEELDSWAESAYGFINKESPR